MIFAPVKRLAVHFCIHSSRRRYSLWSKLNSHSIIISTERGVFNNLALEHWLYTNLKFIDSSGRGPEDALKSPVILIWVNEPCVVIGRHQNPWIESNLGWMHKNDIKLARRHSGGGCVFHDDGNINVSIIGHRDCFEKRQDNLKFISKTIEREFGIILEPTAKHDLVHASTGQKVSGSAAKLGRLNSYHHFTILVDVNKNDLHSSIRKEPQDFIITNSTPSHRCKIMNLTDVRADIGTGQVISCISDAYAKQHETSIQFSSSFEHDGIKQIQAQLESWEWIYGMTPKFELQKNLSITMSGEYRELKLSVVVNKGVIDSVNIKGNSFGLDAQIQRLSGQRFIHKYFMNPDKLTELLFLDCM